jgi:hypothetical protein
LYRYGLAIHIPDLSDYYLVWDADNIATRPIDLFAPAEEGAGGGGGGGGGFKRSKSGRKVVKFCGNPVSHKSTVGAVQVQSSRPSA